MHEALCKSADLLTRYGGHEMAVGLSLEQKNFESFREKMKKIAKDSHADELVSIIKIDKEIFAKDITFDIINGLKNLEPFGEANKIPLFLYKNLRIDSIRSLSEGKHLKLTLKDDYLTVNGIGFGFGDLANTFRLGDKVDVVVALEINEFNNTKSIQLNIKDIRKSI
ncbi:MAG: hypothetical protein HFJ45_03135 [Clostridia bacterium]|nr:hypothetical protein [Clostridia bacterium]